VIREGIQEALQLLLRLDDSVIDAATRSLWVSGVAVVTASVVGISIGLCLARRRFPGRSILVVLFRVGMSVPTVLIGLLCYGLLSRRGALGEFELLYTSTAIILGEFFLALPIVVTLTHGAITRLDRRIFETARTLGAGTVQRTLTYLGEARLAIMLAVLTAFSRCFTELGIAMMVGGNIMGRTRTLTTATALETARGEFASGVAMSLILLSIAMLVTLTIAVLSSGTLETDA
jgi:tungstate transport system permease protein